MEKLDNMARRTHAVEWSGIREMFSLADKISGVINLGIGQPNFDTPSFIRDAAKKSLDDGYTRYPPASGFSDLKREIAKKLMTENNINVDPDREIFVAVGAMQVIFNTILHMVDPGEEVIVIDPGYDYYSQIRLFGAIPVRVPVLEENHFKVDPDDIKKAITNKTKLMILNTPSNPTGAMLDKDTLSEIAKIAQAHMVFVLSDEPYEHIVYDGKPHVSIGSLDGMRDLTISAFTFSKSYAMTGWRVGYAVGPAPIMEEMEKLQEHMVSGVTAMAQRAALAAIKGPQDCVAKMLSVYQKRRELVHERLNAIEGVSCLKPESTFYAFPNIKKLGLSSWDLAIYLVKQHKVALVPGSIFGKNGEGYLRLSFAADSDDLKEGLTRFNAGIQQIMKPHGRN